MTFDRVFARLARKLRTTPPVKFAVKWPTEVRQAEVRARLAAPSGEAQRFRC